MVNRLTAAGYVERRVSALDRRARALRLTERGKPCAIACAGCAGGAGPHPVAARGARSGTRARM
jgi:hypothetical protein